MEDIKQVLAGRKIAKDNLSNLYNINLPLYYLIVKYGISYQYLVKEIYPKEYAEAEAKDEEVKKRGEKVAIPHAFKLSGKLKNRLDGRGKLTPEEHKGLIFAVSDMVNSMKVNLNEAVKIHADQRDKKIQSILDSLDEETLKELKKKL